MGAFPRFPQGRKGGAARYSCLGTRCRVVPLSLWAKVSRDQPRVRIALTRPFLTSYSDTEQHISCPLAKT